jgi:hypothetical protein
LKHEEAVTVHIDVPVGRQHGVRTGHVPQRRIRRIAGPECGAVERSQFEFERS